MFHAWPLLLIFAGRLRERRIARKGLLEFHSHLASGVCRRIRLCGSQCDLCASVVSVFFSNSTTETPRITELAQRNPFFRQAPSARWLTRSHATSQPFQRLTENR